MFQVLLVGTLAMCKNVRSILINSHIFDPFPKRIAVLRIASPNLGLFLISLFLSLSLDGARIASSTGVDILLLDNFKLVINDTSYLVQPPRRGECGHLHYRSSHAGRCSVFNIPLVSITDLLPHEEADRLNDVKFLVQQLYTTLRIEEHQLNKERELIGRLEDLNSQLRPLEKVLMLILD